MKTAVHPQTGILVLLALILLIGIALGILIARPPREAEEPAPTPTEEPTPAPQEILPALVEALPEPEQEPSVTVEESEIEQALPTAAPQLVVPPHPASSMLGLLQSSGESLHLAAGEVYLYDGFGWTWMKPLEGVPVNDMNKDEFQLIEGRPVYMGSAYETLLGVDVSEHQHEIDWKKVANSGVDFAYIRIGRRGYTEGGLYDDPWFESNYEGAVKAGLQVGVYFYSQAVNVDEALEEARFVLDALDGRKLDLPIVFDWEKIDNEDAEIARTRGLGMELRTDCAVAFCDAVHSAGYEACVYFNRNLGYYGFDLSRLTDYSFWFALPIAPPELCWPSFYYKMDIWQFSFSDTVPGIEGETDMNLMFLPVETEE